MCVAWGGFWVVVVVVLVFEGYLVGWVGLVLLCFCNLSLKTCPCKALYCC